MHMPGTMALTTGIKTVTPMKSGARLFVVKNANSDKISKKKDKTTN